MVITPHKRFGISLLALATQIWFFALTGCSGSGLGTALQGIYQISSWTENNSGCAAEGPSILADNTNKYLWLKLQNFFVDFLAGVGCPDLTTCRKDAKEGFIPLFGSWIFSEGSDTAGWKGNFIQAGTISTPGKCAGSVVDFNLSQTGQGAIQIRIETRQSDEFAANSKNECTTDDAERAAKGKPCSKLEVIRATFVEKLP